MGESQPSNSPDAKYVAQPKRHR